MKLISVTTDYYGKPGYSSFYANTDYIVKLWESIYCDWHHDGKEYIYYKGELSLGNQTETIHLSKEDYMELTAGVRENG